jgi:hypothetical protein
MGVLVAKEAQEALVALVILVVEEDQVGQVVLAARALWGAD